MDTQFTQNPNTHEDLVLSTSNIPESAIAWCAVFAGAVASAALSLILLFLGTGFGLTLVSPWSSEGISITSFSVTSILGVTVISLLASAIGGYLAGRLRTRWTNTAKDEVFFRDTAHGFLSWSVATLGTAALLTTVVSSILGGGIKAGSAIADGAANLASGATTAVVARNNEDGSSYNPLPYLLDSLLRKNNKVSANDNPEVNPETPLSSTNTPATHTPSATPNTQFAPHHKISNAELARIFINAVKTGSLPENDLKYAAQLVAQDTGLNQQAAEERVANMFETLQTKLQETENAVKEAADKARKASAYTSLWFFISLLSGAFIASLMAVYGGRQRDL